MTALAIILGLVAAVAVLLLVATFRIFTALCVEVRDALRIMHVLVNSLEAKLLPQMEEARDSADAACSQMDGLLKRLDAGERTTPEPPPANVPQTPASFRRVQTVRETLASLEAESFEAAQRPVEVKRG